MTESLVNPSTRMPEKLGHETLDVFLETSRELAVQCGVRLCVGAMFVWGIAQEKCARTWIMNRWKKRRDRQAGRRTETETETDRQTDIEKASIIASFLIETL